MSSVDLIRRHTYVALLDFIYKEKPAEAGFLSVLVIRYDYPIWPLGGQSKRFIIGVYKFRLI